jgi:hypothetical protein
VRFFSSVEELMPLKMASLAECFLTNVTFMRFISDVTMSLMRANGSDYFSAVDISSCVSVNDTFSPSIPAITTHFILHTVPGNFLTLISLLHISLFICSLVATQLWSCVLFFHLSYSMYFHYNNMIHIPPLCGHCCTCHFVTPGLTSHISAGLS